MAARYKGDRFVDRGDVIGGINSTIRDNRAPYNLARSIENFATPDGRLERRPGFASLIQSIDGNAADHVKGVMLAKHTPTTTRLAEDRTPKQERDTYRNRVFRYYSTPFSYGLIRWHSDIQPTHASDWTMEFDCIIGAPEELVVNPIERHAPADYTATPTYTGPFDSMRGPLDGSNNVICKGVYLYDQTVLAHVMRYRTQDGGTGSLRDPARAFGGVYPQLYYTKGISALAIGYNRTSGGKLQVFCYFSMLDDTTDYGYHEYALTATTTADYAEGDLYHIAVSHDASTRTVTLYLVDVNDFTVTDSTVYASGLEWAGTNDLINDWTAVADIANRVPRAIHRDVVILNEHTARGGYGSTCRSGLTNEAMVRYVDNVSTLASGTVGTRPPSGAWCCSPPQGTAMGELRYWSELRTQTEIEDNAFLRIVETRDATLPAALDAYWPCDEGGKVCADLVGGNDLTVHRGAAPYVYDDELLHGGGLRFGDNQFLDLDLTTPLNGDYITDLYTAFRRIFECRRETTPRQTTGTFVDTDFDPEQDFSIQVQLRTPKQFQQDIGEIHYYTGGNHYYGSQPGELDPSTAQTGQGFIDGDWVNKNLVANASTANHYKPDAYTQTIFSIEGLTTFDDSSGSFADAWDEGLSSLIQNMTVPLVRAFFGPKDDSTGKATLYFEFFHNRRDSSGNIDPTRIAVASGADLDPDTVYTLTFVKRVQGGITSPTGTGYSSGLAAYNSVGCTLEIWIDGSLSNTVSIVDSSAMIHEPSYYLTVGAAFAHNLVDRGQGCNDTAAASAFGINGQVNDTVHAMNQWMDAVGFFTLGFFRMWGSSLQAQDIAAYGTRSLRDDVIPTLLLNTELDNPVGERIPNEAPFDVEFVSRSKDHVSMVAAWGDGNLSDETSRASLAEGDVLGYRVLNESYNIRQWDRPSCQLVMPYRKASSNYDYGVLYFFGGAALRDEDGDGVLTSTYAPRLGVLNEYATNETWRFTNIGNQSFLHSKGGSPKVFDGTQIYSVGFRELWEPAGRALTGPVDGSSYGVAHTADLRYMGVVVAYVSEKYNLVTYAPRQVVAFADTTVAGAVANSQPYIATLPPHPDPRCTLIYVYFTYPQDSRTAAFTAPAYLTTAEPARNSLHQIYIGSFDEDTGYVASPIDVNLTARPSYDYAAQLNGQLYVVSKSRPDTLYRSFIAAPQQFDTVRTQVTLDEGLGDRINGLVSAFGAVFAFRGNSTWRIDPLDTQDAQVTKISEIGAASPDSVIMISLPEQGSPVLFVFSAYGPFLFDGGVFQYIGYGIEDSTAGNSYGWMDVSTVRCVHHPERREVICFYRTIDSGDISEFYDKAIVYNYRFQSWYTWTGLPGAIGSPMLLGAEGSSGSIGQPLAVVGDSQDRMLVLGSDEGQLFKFGADDFDGIGTVKTDTVVSFDGVNALTLTTGLGSGDFVGLDCYILFENTGSFTGWERGKIHHYDDATKVLTLKDQYGAAWSVTASQNPQADDTIQIGLPVTQVTFPWDGMDTFLVDKKVTNLLLWSDGTFYSRLYRNWDSSLVSSWVSITDQNGKRSRYYFANATHGEVFKLELVSFHLDARLDAYGYLVVDEARGVTSQ